jgi:hypothetical protein
MMQSKHYGLAVVAVLILATTGPRQSKAEPLPTVVGACSVTKVKEIAYRLGTPDSGSAISYVNGGVQISYEIIPQIHRSRVGDKVTLCLVSLPENCPPRDDRGKIYRAINLRTGESWQAPDSQHMCGGA